MVSIHRPLGYEPNALPLRHFAGDYEGKMVRRPGIEPGPPAWKAGILTTELTTLNHVGLSKMVTGVGFEPTPPKRLVPKTSALDHSATQPDHWEKENASAWDRTRDLSVNSRALYQLSHGGSFC